MTYVGVLKDMGVRDTTPEVVPIALATPAVPTLFADVC